MAAVFTMLATELRRIDTYQRTHRRAAFAYAVVKKYSEDQAGQRAGLFAYYGFLSLFPLLLVLTSVLRLALRNKQLSGQIVHGATTYFPIVGQDLQQNIHGLGRTGLALIVGLALTLYGARGVADVVRNSVDHFWGTPHAKRSGFPDSILKSLNIIVIGGGGLLLAPILSGYVLGFNHGVPLRVLTLFITLFLLFWVLVFVIKTGSSLPRPLEHIWVGAAVAAVGLEILQAIGGYIVARELRHLNTLYGTFALVLGLLYWIYLQSQVLFYAFEIDPVRVLKLWPRSVQPPLTTADHQSFQLYAGRAVYHEENPQAEAHE